MACGNNNISRSYLASQPTSSGARDGVASRLAAGPARTAGATAERAGYRSVHMSPEQVRSAAERRLAAAKAQTKSGSYPRAPEIGGRQQYYTAMHADGTIHEFVDANVDQTFARMHVHVIHDERNDEVRLHVSLGNGSERHSEKIALVGATGRDVDAAVDLLTDALRTRGR
jgi:hypothetical protein